VIRRFCGLALLLCLGACTSLQPIDKAEQTTPAAADAPFWVAASEVAPPEWFVLLNDGPSALDWRLRAIDSAVEQIDLQTFLWHADVAGTAIIDHLLWAAERGVQVRALIDDSLLLREESLLRAFARHERVQLRVFNPSQARSSDLLLRAVLNSGEHRRLDHRMHNKALVVDNRVAIIGGRNLADEYFGLDEAANFRDIELMAGGSVVAEISSAFDDYWNSAWTFPIDTLDDGEITDADLAALRNNSLPQALYRDEDAEQRDARWLELVQSALPGNATLFVDRAPELNPAAPEDAPVQVANELVTLFDEARSEVVVVSAYLIPTPELEGAVRRAIDRGVRIRILTNSLGSNNHIAAHGAYRNYIESLLDSGAELHEVRTDARDRSRYMLSPAGRKILALHAKALIIDDDRVFVGSANLDPRSLRLNTEIGLLVEGEALNRHLRDALEADFLVENAWRLELRDDRVYWINDSEETDSIPADSQLQRFEDWVFSLLPIEGEL